MSNTTTQKLTVKKSSITNIYYVFIDGTDRHYTKGYKRLSNAIKFAEELARIGYGEYVGTDEKEEPKKKKQAPTCDQFGVKVGDVWYSSWGCEQTNIDYYEVTKTTKCSVWLTPIAQRDEEDGWCSGTTTPRPGHYTGKPKMYRITSYGTARVTSYADAHPWDGKPKRFSTYA